MSTQGSEDQELIIQFLLQDTLQRLNLSLSQSIENLWQDQTVFSRTNAGDVQEHVHEHVQEEEETEISQVSVFSNVLGMSVK